MALYGRTSLWLHWQCNSSEPYWCQWWGPQIPNSLSSNRLCLCVIIIDSPRPLLNIFYLTNFDSRLKHMIRERSLNYGRASGGGQKFECKEMEGGKISVQRDLKALLKHLENTVKIFCRRWRSRSLFNTIPLLLPMYLLKVLIILNVTGHLGIIQKILPTDNTTIASSKFTCKCIGTNG